MQETQTKLVQQPKKRDLHVFVDYWLETNPLDVMPVSFHANLISNNEERTHMVAGHGGKYASQANARAELSRFLGENREILANLTEQRLVFHIKRIARPKNNLFALPLNADDDDQLERDHDEHPWDEWGKDE